MCEVTQLASEEGVGHCELRQLLIDFAAWLDVGWKIGSACKRMKKLYSTYEAGVKEEDSVST